MKQLSLTAFDGVAFDLEGTLADTLPAHFRSSIVAFTKHGYGHITEEEHAHGALHGSTYEDITGHVLHAAGVIEKTMPFADHPMVRRLAQASRDEFVKEAAQGFTEMPGATAFVKTIAAHFAKRLCLVTSAPEDHAQPFIDKYVLGECFPSDRVIGENIIVAEGLQCKPAADPYLLAMKRIGATHLLVFEDTVVGTAAAKKAGATVIALGSNNRHFEALSSPDLEYPPDVVVRSYDEACQVLDLPA